jgi:hypothetical protein
MVYNQPWGSRWDIDPHFSSAKLAVDHIGADVWRAEKLRRIAHENIVRRHLRVCWENFDPQLNCCRCEKCIRTMLILETCGQLGHYESFRGGRGLLDAIDRIPSLHGPIIRVYELLLQEGLGDASAAAVRRLIARSAA